MKRTLFALILALVLCLCAMCALADHSVLPKEGDLNETEALNCAVKLLCEDSGLTEEEVKGHWYYWAVYYDDPLFIDDYSGSVWDVQLVDPERSGEKQDFEHYWIHRSKVYYLNGMTGEIVERGEDYYEEEELEVWEGENPYDWCYPLVPTEDQMQPDEAIRMTQDILSEAVGVENADEWQDYNLYAVTDNGRFWYRMLLGNHSINPSNPFSLTVWLDASTHEVIWHSDLDRLAFRYNVYQTTGSWSNWYKEQVAEYEEKWGSRNTWNYQQYAEFEEHCAGRPDVPEKFYDVPGLNEIGYEEACSRAIAWQEANDQVSRTWTVKNSAFIVDVYLEGWTNEMMPSGIPPEYVRRWSIVLTSDDPEPVSVEIYIDPATGEIVDGPVG